MADELPLAVVVVQYGHPDETIRTLADLAAATPRPAKLVVVDNASPGDAADRIAEACRAAGATLLRSADNLGYAGGANLAVRPLLDDQSLRYVAYCNNDVALPPTYFARLVAVLDDTGGAAASGVLVTRGSGEVQSAGGRFVPWRALVVEDRAPRDARPYRTDFLSGCTLVVRSDDLRAHGLLPSAYAPGYLEDAELCWRLRSAGRTLWVVPDAIATHAVGASFGALAASPRTTEAVVRHRLWFARRNLRGPVRWAALAYQAATKPLRGAVELVRGRPAFASATWRGWWRGAFGRWPAGVLAAALLCGLPAGRSAAQDAGPALSRPVATPELIGSEWEDRRRLHELLGGPWARQLLRRVQVGASDDSSARQVERWLQPSALLFGRSPLPGGGNDGGLWQGSGVGVSVTLGGVLVKDRRFRVLVAPEVMWASNSPVTLIQEPFWAPPLPPPRSPYASPWNASPWTAIPYTLDMPWRYGDRPFARFGLGQSGAWWQVGAVELGATTEHEWWGPALRNALVLSHNADGIPRLAARSMRPLQFGFGDVEFSYGLGTLRTSPFFDETDQGSRSWNGLAIAVQPRGVPGLTVGLTRAVIGELGPTAWLRRGADVFANVPMPLAPPGDSSRVVRDQIASIFGRWVLPGDGTELYAEFGRAVQPTSLRDLLVEPNHSLGYTLGLQRVAPGGRPGTWWRVQAEATFTEQSPSYRTRPQASWYSSRGVTRGFTHDGQVLGSAIGPAGSEQFFGVDRLAGRSRVGVYAQRTRRNQDAFFSLPWNYAGGQGFCEFDVASELGVRGAFESSRAMVRWQAGWMDRLNVFFQKNNGCPGVTGFAPRDQSGLSVRFDVSALGGSRAAPRPWSRPAPARPASPALPGVVREADAWVGSEGERRLLAVALASPDTGMGPLSLRTFSPRVLSRLGAERTEGWSVVAPEVGLRVNSTYPWGSYDGAVWAGRGPTGWAMGGVAWRSGRVAVRLAPLAFVAANTPFPLFTGRSDGDLREPQYPRTVDLPQRFGTEPYARLDPGQSEVRVDALGATVGLSSGNQWWGPAQFFPFLFSNQAAGIPRLFAGTAAPVNVGIGQLHGEVSWGVLGQSATFDTSGTVARPRRFGAGVVAVFQPRGFEQLEVGVGRYFHARWPDRGVPGRYWWRPFSGVFKASLPVESGSIGGDDRSVDGENQLASAFARLALPGSGAELYAEAGREDHSWDVRDIVVAPDQQSSLLVGVARAWRRGDALTVGRIEWLNHQARSIDRARGGASIYTHSSGSNQGHTQHGQLLGAPTGPGSAAGAVITVERFTPVVRTSWTLTRILRRQRLSPLATPATLDARALDVQYALAFERQPVRTGALGWGAALTWNYNRDFTSDRGNASIWIRWRPRGVGVMPGQ